MKPPRVFRPAVVALFCSLVVAIGTMSPAHAATRLGGVSMSGACVNQYGNGWEAYLETRKATGWKCGFRPYPNVLQKAGRAIDVNKQCQTQYRNSRAYGRYSNINDPYSWSCYRP